MTAHELAAKVAKAAGARSVMIGENASAQFFRHPVAMRDGVGACDTPYDRVAMHDDCEIEYGVCPHGFMSYHAKRDVAKRTHGTSFYKMPEDAARFNMDMDAEEGSQR
jgi:hypothetical protein